MDRRELIDFANAALRLGDWFVPPMASQILVEGNKRALVRQYGRTVTGLFFIARTFTLFSPKPSEPVTHYISEGTLFTLYRLPKYYRDFDKWIRSEDAKTMCFTFGGLPHESR